MGSGLRVLHDSTFGHLQAQVFRRQLVLCDQGADILHQIRFRK